MLNTERQIDFGNPSSPYSPQSLFNNPTENPHTVFGCPENPNDGCPNRIGNGKTYTSLCSHLMRTGQDCLRPNNT